MADFYVNEKFSIQPNDGTPEPVEIPAGSTVEYSNGFVYITTPKNESLFYGVADNPLEQLPASTITPKGDPNPIPVVTVETPVVSAAGTPVVPAAQADIDNFWTVINEMQADGAQGGWDNPLFVDAYNSAVQGGIERGVITDEKGLELRALATPPLGGDNGSGTLPPPANNSYKIINDPMKGNTWMVVDEKGHPVQYCSSEEKASEWITNQTLETVGAVDPVEQPVPGAPPPPQDLAEYLRGTSNGDRILVIDKNTNEPIVLVNVDGEFIGYNANGDKVSSCPVPMTVANSYDLAPDQSKLPLPPKPTGPVLQEDVEVTLPEGGTLVIPKGAQAEFQDGLLYVDNNGKYDIYSVSEDAVKGLPIPNPKREVDLTSVKDVADYIRENSLHIDSNDPTGNTSLKGDPINGHAGVNETIIAEAAAKVVALSKETGDLSKAGTINRDGSISINAGVENPELAIVGTGILTSKDYDYLLKKGRIQIDKAVDYSKYVIPGSGNHKNYRSVTPISDAKVAEARSVDQADLQRRKNELYDKITTVADRWFTVNKNLDAAIAGSESEPEKQQLYEALQGALTTWFGNLTANIDAAMIVVGKWAESVLSLKEAQVRYNTLLKQYNELKAKEPKLSDGKYTRTRRVHVGNDDKGNPEYRDEQYQDSGAYGKDHDEWEAKMTELEEQIKTAMDDMDKFEKLVETYQQEMENYGISIQNLSIFLKDHEELQDVNKLKNLQENEIQDLIDEAYDYDINKTVSSLSDYAVDDEVYYAGDRKHHTIKGIDPLTGALILDNGLVITDPRKIIPDGNTQHWGENFSAVITDHDELNTAWERVNEMADSAIKVADSGVRAVESMLDTTIANSKTTPQREVPPTVKPTVAPTVKPTDYKPGPAPSTQSGPGGPQEPEPKHDQKPEPKPTNIPKTTNPTTPRITTPTTPTTPPVPTSPPTSMRSTTYEPIPGDFGPDPSYDVPPIDIFGPGTGINSAAPTRSSSLTGLGALAGLAAGAAGIGALALGNKDGEEEKKEEENKVEERREMVLEEQPIPAPVAQQEENIDILE